MPEETKPKHCLACGTPDYEKPMCFQGELWCSDDCRKLIQGEINGTTFTIVTGKAFNEVTGLYDLSLHTSAKTREINREKARRRAAAKKG